MMRRPAVQLPVRLTAGLGCDRGTPLDTLHTALEQALALARLGQPLADPSAAGAGIQLVALASIAAKSDEMGLLALAQRLALPLHFYSAPRLAQVAVPNPSPTVLRYMGTPSVSEAAALLAAGTLQARHLCVEKHKWRGPDGKNATVSLALWQAAPLEDAPAV